jgi:hypothetical protein
MDELLDVKFELCYTGGGIWLSMAHIEMDDDVYSYVVSSDFKDEFTGYINIGSDYNFTDENMQFSLSAADLKILNNCFTWIYNILLENLNKVL